MTIPIALDVETFMCLTHEDISALVLILRATRKTLREEGRLAAVHTVNCNLLTLSERYEELVDEPLYIGD